MPSIGIPNSKDDLAVSTNWGSPFCGCPDVIRGLLLGVYIRAPEFLEASRFLFVQGRQGHPECLLLRD